MHALLADLQVDHGHHKNDPEQNERGSTGNAIVGFGQSVVNSGAVKVTQ